MDIIKHYSFDLWLTIIKSNPIFKEERASYFYKNFNRKNKSVDEVKAIFRYNDDMCNAINEVTGQNISAQEMYLMVLYQLNESLDIMEEFDMAHLNTEMDLLFFRYSPLVYSQATIDTLYQLASKNNITLNILSNTAFIKGELLRELLNNLDVAKYFDFQIYSDEIGMSKPNINLYYHLIENIQTMRNKDNIQLSEILHIGDNYKADYLGAKAAGLNALLINSNDQLITKLLH